MSEYTAELQDAARFMREHDDFLIISHVSPDGDTTGSALAVGLMLEQLGKRCTLVNEGETPAKFGFLPGCERIVNLREQPLGRMFSHVIAVDAADSKRIGEAASLLSPDARIVNIDHHPTNDRFGQVNVIRTDAAATAEIIYELAAAGQFPIDESIATCLYTGLLTDTGGFRYSNTTSRVMEIAARLLAYGIKPGEIAERCLESITLEHVHLLKRALGALSLHYNNRVAALKVSHADLAETNAAPDDLSGLVNYGRNIEGVEVGVLLTENAPGVVKVSLRSRSLVDVAEIAKSLGGGGHARAAGCTLKGGLEQAEGLVLAKLGEALAGVGLCD
ncbi:DHH family phosphoesterase [Brevibacillus massiliensis]|jgi:phosphoesterase RecJ-like protein|uniref:DHH family phosphoesterase n=1 Tax=Brevibacillus massiliensis TaxID=1118054 RepID=UPI000302E9D9|nr:bifunctional oligoribonuclease/PAP phosphatase NrnA [Brevibacillus massiliensis]